MAGTPPQEPMRHFISHMNCWAETEMPSGVRYGGYTAGGVSVTDTKDGAHRPPSRLDPDNKRVGPDVFRRQFQAKTSDEVLRWNETPSS